MKKIIAFLLMLFMITGCENQIHFIDLDLGSNCIHAVEGVQYNFRYESYTSECISIEITINHTYNEKNYPLYFYSKNGYFKAVEVGNVMYNTTQYGKYFGEIKYDGKRFMLKCYLSDKGKQKNLDPFDLTMDHDMIKSNKNESFEAHYIRIELR